MPTYPDIVPDYVTDLGLSDFGAVITETDIKTEKRRFKHLSGIKTQINLRYNFLRATEVGELIEFFKSVRGTHGEFTLPPVLLINPNDYNIALAALVGGLFWRFAEKLVIQTIQADFYSVDVKLTSVSRSTIASDGDIAFVDTTVLSLNANGIVLDGAVGNQCSTAILTLIGDELNYLDDGVVLTADNLLEAQNVTMFGVISGDVTNENMVIIAQTIDYKKPVTTAIMVVLNGTANSATFGGSGAGIDIPPGIPFLLLY